jgi:hypothetical protein
VKTFGFQLFQDFSDAQDDLASAADDAFVVRSAQFDAVDQATFTALRRLSGSEFDRAFVTFVVAELTANRTTARSFNSGGQSSAVQISARALDAALSRFIAMARDMETYF